MASDDGMLSAPAMGPASNSLSAGALLCDPDFLEKFDAFALKLHQSLRLHEVLAIAVHDARLLIGCDRVSVAMSRQGQCRLLAISGQDQVERRSPEVRALESLAGEVIRIAEPVRYCGTLTGYPARIEQHQLSINSSGTVQLGRQNM